MCLVPAPGGFDDRLDVDELGTPGEHALVSRVTEMNGKVQPTPAELESKKSFLEENSQVTRKVTIA